MLVLKLLSFSAANSNELRRGVIANPAQPAALLCDRRQGAIHESSDVSPLAACKAALSEPDGPCAVCPHEAPANVAIRESRIG